jgi:hypothetical protein
MTNLQNVCFRSIVLKKDVSAGDELFCDYGYLDNYYKVSMFKKIVFLVADAMDKRLVFGLGDNAHPGGIFASKAEAYPSEHLKCASLKTWPYL